MHQVHYYDRKGNEVIENIEGKSLKQIKRMLSKIEITGNASIYDTELRKTFWYRPRKY